MSEAKKQIYKLTERPQLIDLNQNYKNFNLSFQANAINPPESEFDAIILSQEQLDATDVKNIQMKKAKNGKIGGNIVADNDRYQNYFLLLKSATPTDVEVLIDVREIPANVIDQKEAEMEENEPSDISDRMVESFSTNEKNVDADRIPFWKKPIFWILATIALCFILYYFYYYIYIPYLEKKMSAVVQTDTTVTADLGSSAVNEGGLLKKKNIYSQLAEIA